jgi:nitrogen fixation protein FixH
MSESSDGHYHAAAEGMGPGTWIVDVMITRPTSAGKDTTYAIRRRLWLKP